jgi:hypothetical protein
MYAEELGLISERRRTDARPYHLQGLFALHPYRIPEEHCKLKCRDDPVEELMSQGNVFDMTSLNLLAIKPKTWRDLISDEPFQRSDIITIQDPNNLASRDLREYDYVKKDRKVTDDDMEGDPLKGINVDAAGGAGKVLKMIAEKVS